MISPTLIKDREASSEWARTEGPRPNFFLEEANKGDTSRCSVLCSFELEVTDVDLTKVYFRSNYCWN